MGNKVFLFFKCLSIFQLSFQYQSKEEFRKRLLFSIYIYKKKPITYIFPFKIKICGQKTILIRSFPLAFQISIDMNIFFWKYWKSLVFILYLIGSPWALFQLTLQVLFKETEINVERVFIWTVLLPENQSVWLFI